MEKTRSARVLEWRSLTGWEAVTEFDLREMGETLNIDPRGPLLPLARALVAYPYVATRFGGKEARKSAPASVESPSGTLEMRIRKLTKRVA